MKQKAPSIGFEIWSRWDIDRAKMVKAYNDNLEFDGWLYWGCSKGIIHLSNY